MQLNWLGNSVDFVLAFAVVHEMPDAATFFAEAAVTMKPVARMLLAEPSGHVSEEEFEAELEMARGAGLEVEARLTIRRSRTVVLRKSYVSSTKLVRSYESTATGKYPPRSLARWHLLPLRLSASRKSFP